MVRRPPPTATALIITCCLGIVLTPALLAADDPPIEVTVRESAAQSVRVVPSNHTVPEIRALRDAAPPPEDFDERLDWAHDGIYTGVQVIVEATDNWLADRDRELKPVQAVPFRLGIGLELLDRDDGWKTDLDVDFEISVQLPNLEDRLRFFVTSDELDESPRDARTDSALRAGMRVELARPLDFSVGVRLDLPPTAFASLRWTEQYSAGNWDIYPVAKLFVESSDGLGYVAAATFDHWEGRNLLRSSSFARWSSSQDRLEWTQTLIYAHARELIQPDRYESFVRATDVGRGWGVRLLASGGEFSREVNYYEAALFFRRPMGRDWLYLFVEPLVRWDRDYRWDADPGIRIGIDALFWDLARD